MKFTDNALLPAVFVSLLFVFNAHGRSICDRTKGVKVAIEKAVQKPCYAITPSDLNAISGRLDVSNKDFQQVFSQMTFRVSLT